MPTDRRYVETDWPPPPSPDETAEERAIRQEEEKEAKRVSDAIDERLTVEREQKKKHTGAKILLLGQAESGKSTVLKNFQLLFSPKAFAAESELWRPIIHLNLLRSVNFILDILGSSSAASRPTSDQGHSRPGTSFNDDLRRLRIRLTPLKQVEESLTKRISGPTFPTFEPDAPSRYHPAKASEISVRSGTGWKGLLKFRRQSDSSPTGRNFDRAEDTRNRRILSACADDISALWAHEEVQESLREMKISLQDQPGFFLDDVARVSQEEYVPTAEDILRARVQTIGPEEHHIPIEAETGKEWIIYDVGGSRSQRSAWAQFFDDVTAIIFLAPVSAFNQVLAEDETVNRLADSMKLWRSICTNKLLVSVDLILFLNKMDILDMQLKSGIRFNKYVTSYKDRPNDTKSVAKYMMDIFTSLHNQNSPRRRNIYVHPTCATDVKATALVISQIREVILLKTLEHTNII